MLLIIAFIVANCIIAIFLESKKFRVASFAHLFMFLALLICLLLTSGVSYLSAVSNCLLNEYSLAVMQGAFVHSGTVLAPMSLLELVLLSVVLIACVITVAEVTDAIKSAIVQDDAHQRNSSSESRIVTSADEIFPVKKYIQNCKLIC